MKCVKEGTRFVRQLSSPCASDVLAVLEEKKFTANAQYFWRFLDHRRVQVPENRLVKNVTKNIALLIVEIRQSLEYLRSRLK
jgi:hypothetical protein